MLHCLLRGLCVMGLWLCVVTTKFGYLFLSLPPDMQQNAAQHCTCIHPFICHNVYLFTQGVGFSEIGYPASNPLPKPNSKKGGVRVVGV